SHWLDTKRERPNGLLYDNNRLIVASFNSGIVRFLDIERKEFDNWTEKIPSADGIARVGAEGYLVSNWNGEIYFVNNARNNWKVHAPNNNKINAADIYYNEEQGLLYVPSF